MAGKRSSAMVQIGIYLVSLIMAGAIGVSSSIHVFMEHYGITQVAALNVVSVPCFAVVIITLVSGWLMSRVAKKAINLVGILLFAIGGLVPALLESWTLVILFRFIFGLGLGMVQCTTTSLIAENFEDAEKDKVMGRSMAFQMLGIVIFSFIGGRLGAVPEVGYKVVFLVHALAVLAALGVAFCIPYRKPVVQATDAAQADGPIKITAGVVLWTVICLLFYVMGQVYSNVINILLEELSLGGTQEAGLSLSVFAVGGFLAGLIFGKIFGKTRNLTLSLGLVVLGIAYLGMAFSGALSGVYIAAFACGFAFSVVAACILSSTSAAAINPTSAAFALSLAACAQSLGQSLSGYVTTPLGQALSVATGYSVNQMTLSAAAIVVFVLAIVFLFWGIKKNRA